MKDKIAQLRDAVRALQAELVSDGAGLSCGIVVSEGDWGGHQMILKVDLAAAVFLAGELLDLVSRDVPGAHLHIDKAGIAPDTDHQLVVALR